MIVFQALLAMISNVSLLYLFVIAFRFRYNCNKDENKKSGNGYFHVTFPLHGDSCLLSGAVALYPSTIQ